MSTILKALKKSEASGQRSGAPFVRASVSEGKSRWLLVPVTVCIVVLGYFLASHLLRAPASTGGTARTAGPSPAGHAAPETEAPALNAQAVALINAGRNAEAEALLRAAIEKHPDDPYLHNHLGLALKNQERPLEAVGEYEMAIGLKPDYYIAMNNLAVALETAGDRERAAEFYGKALAGNPAMSGAHLNYALLLESQGRLDEAENHYRTFLTLSGDESLKGLVRKRLKALR